MAEAPDPFDLFGAHGATGIERDVEGPEDSHWPREISILPRVWESVTGEVDKVMALRRVAAELGLCGVAQIALKAPGSDATTWALTVLFDADGWPCATVAISHAADPAVVMTPLAIEARSPRKAP